VFLDFYVAAYCNLGFTICGQYVEQVWPPLQETICIVRELIVKGTLPWDLTKLQIMTLQYFT